jgi:hypothetical protein
VLFEVLFLTVVAFLLEVVLLEELTRLLDEALAIVWCRLGR